MLKLILIVIAIYAILQFGLGVDINKKLEPMFEAVMSKAEDELPGLGQKLLDNLSTEDLKGLLESQDINLDQVSDLIDSKDISLDKLSDLMEEHDINGENAQEKIKQLKALVEEKMKETK